MDKELSSNALAPPGAGLPLLEGLFARWVLFPLTTAWMSDTQASHLLQSVGMDIQQCLKTHSEEALTTPVLIKRLPGLEDSSRYWSVAMVVEHLLITGQAMQTMVKQLAHGQADLPVVRTADVKPTTELPATGVLAQQHEAFVAIYIASVTPLIPTFKPNPKHPHPWFGPMTAHQWHCLNAIHHRLHWQQVQAILKGLSSPHCKAN